MKLLTSYSFHLITNQPTPDSFPPIELLKASWRRFSTSFQLRLKLQGSNKSLWSKDCWKMSLQSNLIIANNIFFIYLQIFPNCWCFLILHCRYVQKRKVTKGVLIIKNQQVYFFCFSRILQRRARKNEEILSKTSVIISHELIFFLHRNCFFLTCASLFFIKFISTFFLIYYHQVHQKLWSIEA